VGLTCRWDEREKRFYLPPEYARAVADAGALPVLIPLLPDAAAEIAGRLDAVVLTGSPSDVDPARYGAERRPEVRQVHPERDATDFALLKSAFSRKLPVLGICFGMQSLNVHLGGTLVQHIPAQVPGALEHRNEGVRHSVALEAGSLLRGWAGTAEAIVNSTHHQAVEKLGAGLRVAARADDGVIEAAEGQPDAFPGQFVVAVQWHPERLVQEDAFARRIFAEFVRAARGAGGVQ